MPRQKKKQRQSGGGFLARLASGGANQRGRRRRSNRPRGEGRGLIDSVRSLIGRYSLSGPLGPKTVHLLAATPVRLDSPDLQGPRVTRERREVAARRDAELAV